MKPSHRTVSHLSFITILSFFAILQLYRGIAIQQPLDSDTSDIQAEPVKPFPTLLTFDHPNATLYLPAAAAAAAATTTNNASSEFTVHEILELCRNGQDLTITKTYAFRITKDAAQQSLSRYENTCYPLEIISHQGTRSTGICADFVPYIYYGHARLNAWVSAESHERKANMCANKSVILHGEHVIHETLDRMENWWMPNIEQLNDRSIPLLAKMRRILCKTKITCQRLGAFIDGNQPLFENRTSSEILRFMSHSTPDVSRDLPPQVLTPLGNGSSVRILQDFNKFLHLSGNSGRKNTDHVVDCWKRHPFWPQLTVGSTKTAQQFGILHPWIHKNIRIVASNMPFPELRKIQVSHGVHLCPSQMEGYGHYINEARSLGALVVTTDAPPMNEFVEEGVSGLMFPVRHSVENAPGSLNFNLTFPPSFVYPVNFRANLICQAIKQKVLKMPLWERERLGREGRKRYERDTEEMVVQIEALMTETLEIIYGRNGTQEWKRVETLFHTELISSFDA